MTPHAAISGSPCQATGAGDTDLVISKDIRPTKDVLVDPEPDQRGNVLAMALIDGGPVVALTVNAN